MIKKRVSYPGVRFGEATVEKARDALEQIMRREILAFSTAIDLDPFEPPEPLVELTEMWIQNGLVQWDFDSEPEFFADYRGDFGNASVVISPVEKSRWVKGKQFHPAYSSSVRLFVAPESSRVEVSCSRREDVQALSGVFDRDVPASRITSDEIPAEDPLIFIGHGGSGGDWLVLQNELQNIHRRKVESFETGARAGHAIRDILDDALDRSSFAILVLSKADEQADGNFHARQNVVHEAGLFQGRLGFNRAIILVEEGAQLFSNLDGIQHVTYHSGAIRGAVGDLIAALDREFPK